MTAGVASVRPRMEQPQQLAPGLFRMCTLIPRRSIELGMVVAMSRGQGARAAEKPF